MKRKFLLALLTVLCLIFTFTAFACENTKEPETEEPGWYNPTEEIKTLYFADLSYSLERYSVITLNPNYNGKSKVSWESSDSNVAKVIDGQVLGVSMGVATITASADGESAVCTVVVSNSIQFVALSTSQSEVELAVGKTKTVYPMVIDNNGVNVGEKFATFSFESEDENIVTVSDKGVITAKNMGCVNVKVMASYAGRTMMQTIAVEVKENVNLSFDKSITELYANSLNGTKKNVETLNVYVYENDNLVINPEIVWSVEDQNIAKIENGVVTAVSQGETIVTAGYTATGGTDVVTSIKVKVVYAEIKLEEKLSLEVFDKNNNTLDLNKYSNYFDGQFNSVKVFDDLGTNISATIDGGMVTIENRDLIFGERQLNFVINSQIKFTCPATIVTKYISNADELANFAVDYGNRDNQDNYSGWFILNDNIDMSGKIVDCAFGKDGNAYQVSDDTIGFSGIFDGNGYTVFNLENSLFGRVSKNGVIKNLSIYTENLKESGTIAHLFAGTLENVNITVDLSKVSASHYSAIAYRTLGDAVIKNVVVEVLNMGNTATAAIIYDVNNFKPKFENTYVITPSINDPMNSGAIELEVIHYSASEQNKDFSKLDKSSGLWTLHDGIYVFDSSIYYRLDKISAPSASTFNLSEDGTLTWTAVDNADGYTVLINGKTIDVATNTLTGVTGDVVIQIKAKGNGIIYRDGDYSDKFVYINPKAPYVADFDSLAYAEIVSAVDTSGRGFVATVNSEYLEEYQGEKGVLKINAFSYAGYGIGISVKLPKGYKESGYTLKYRVEKFTDANTGVEHPSVRYISVDDGLRYDNDTSHWLISGSGLWYNFPERFNTWHTEYCDMTNKDTTKDKLGFVISPEEKKIIDGETYYGACTIYLSFVMDGDQREYIKELENQAAIDAIKNALKDKELLTFDSDAYKYLVSYYDHVDEARAGTVNNDPNVKVEVEVLNEYAGEESVLKISGSQATIYNPVNICVGITLPKAYTNGYTIKWRIEEQDASNPSIRYQSNDDGFRYSTTQSYHLYGGTETKWGGLTTVTDDRYDTWHTEYCYSQYDTTRDKLGFVFSTLNKGGWTLYISYVMDGDTTNA